LVNLKNETMCKMCFQWTSQDKKLDKKFSKEVLITSHGRYKRI